MKTRYKILIVLGSFIGFYFALIPALEKCNSFDLDCTAVQNLILLTRPVVTVDTWYNPNSMEWSGSAQGIEKPSVIDSLKHNQNFILSMIVFPICIISTVVLWDKRK